MTEHDPLIAALEARVKAAEEAEKRSATKTVTTNIYSARLRWWTGKKRRAGTESPPLFAFTHQPVVHNGKRGYASCILFIDPDAFDVYEISKPSIGVHRTRREAKQRAYDLRSGWRLAQKLSPNFGLWNEPKA